MDLSEEVCCGGWGLGSLSWTGQWRLSLGHFSRPLGVIYLHLAQRTHKIRIFHRPTDTGGPRYNRQKQDAQAFLTVHSKWIWRAVEQRVASMTHRRTSRCGVFLVWRNKTNKTRENFRWAEPRRVVSFAQHHRLKHRKGWSRAD